MVYRPFDTVPPELLSHILSLAWLSDTRDDSLARFRFPYIVGQVDRYFNRITLSTHILWSYLRVTKVTELDHIQDRIQRSGLVPLQLCLIFANTHFLDAIAMVEGTIVKNTTLRFQGITLLYRESSMARSNNTVNFWKHLNLLSSLSLPLDVVYFSMVDDGAHVPLLHFLPPFAHSLRSLELFGCTFSWRLGDLPKALESLAIYEERPIGIVVKYNNVIRRLGGSLCQSLRSLSLKGLTMEHSLGVAPLSYIFPSLEELEIGGFPIVWAVALLHSISTPRLQHLSIGNIYNQPHSYRERHRIIWKALRFPTLRKTTLQAFSGDELQLVDLIANLPDSVKHLEIIQDQHQKQPDPTVLCLGHQLTNPFFLGLDHISTDGISPRTLVSLIVGRCTALKTLQAKFKDAPLPDGAQAQDWLFPYFDVLSGSAKEFKIAYDGEGQDVDRRGRRPWRWWSDTWWSRF